MKTLSNNSATKIERYRQLTFIPDGAHSFPQLPHLQGKCAWCRMKYHSEGICVSSWKYPFQSPGSQGHWKGIWDGTTAAMSSSLLYLWDGSENQHITCLKICKGNERLSYNLHPSFYICNMISHNLHTNSEVVTAFKLQLWVQGRLCNKCPQ